ncbi:hypothetical protein EJB05_33633, partial [Eragrostis curvula]
MSDPEGQIGVVTKATTSLDLVRLGGGGEPTVVARGVSPTELRRVGELSIGDYVVSGPWLGRVVEVSVDVDVQIGDGVVCRVTDAGDDKLEVIGDDKPEVTKTMFYPGQHVKSSAQLNGRFEGIVGKVEMGAVLVHWVASAALGTNRDLIKASAPPAYQPNPHDLTLFASCADCYWGVGDRFFFQNPCADDMGGSSLPPPRRKALIMTGRRREETEGNNLRPPVQVQEPMSVADTHTTVDVLWQDGTRWHSVRSASLVPSDTLNYYEFFPGERVISKVASGAKKHLTAADAAATVAGPASGHGIVRSAAVGDQTVRVSWLETMESVETVLRHEISDLEEQSISQMEKEMSDWMANDAIKEETEDKEENHAVAAPVLCREISVSEEQTISEMDGQMGDWVAIDAIKDAQDTDDNHMPPLLCGERRHEGTDGDPKATLTLEPAAIVVEQLNGDGSETIVVEEDVDSNVCAWEKSTANAHGDALFCFPQFHVMQMSPPDHYFLNDMEQVVWGGKNWIMTVRKEWKILENDLPDTIYVRAFKDRMDLLRVAMVGAIGTPYQDGLFFFDLQLPPRYPAVPPLVHYHCFSLKFNPKLEESGTVRLSLLNTLDGEGVELWSSETSTILQVVVSIQRLVLTAQPFYDEPGNEQYLGTPEAARNEVVDAEDACLVTLRTMLNLLHRRRRGSRILCTTTSAAAGGSCFGRARRTLSRPALSARLTKRRTPRR